MIIWKHYRGNIHNAFLDNQDSRHVGVIYPCGKGFRWEIRFREDRLVLIRCGICRNIELAMRSVVAYFGVLSELEHA